ncbi:hypothetical protein [Georgenia sp. H159]|uniref:hypothetical protein n=1 Tax=Georgenia sp. H159 TaxID=3076115 RepID=UPI002D77935F|nr:hypothetical protein [Georgenia sp. H159]
MSAPATWRMDLPEGWVAWEPGTSDAASLAADATTTARAAAALRRRIRVVEKETTLLPGDVRHVGVRMTEPRSGQVSAGLYLTQWPRPVTDGKQLTARRHLDALRAAEPAPHRVHRHREVSVEQVPAGQLVLRNEVWRPQRKLGWVVELEATIFPSRTDTMFELTVRSRHLDLQPQLMAELSLMAHGFRLA